MARLNKDQVQSLKTYTSEYLACFGIDTSKQYFRCVNPEHNDEHASMSLNRKNGRVHCWSCGADGDIYDVCSWITGAQGLRNQYEIITQTLNISTPCDLMAIKTDQRADHAPEVAREDITSAIQAAFYALYEHPAALDYLYRRAFTDETITRVGFGWISHPSVIYSSCKHYPTGQQGYLVLPFIDERGRADYATFRPLFNANFKEYKPKGITPAPYYNAHKITRASICITESVFDAVSIEELTRLKVSSIGINGTSNARAFCRLLDQQQVKPKNILVAMDNDASGAEAATIIMEHIERHYQRLKINCTRLEYPKGCNDPNAFLIRARNGATCASN